jgi:Heavy metal associated domain 2
MVSDASSPSPHLPPISDYVHALPGRLRIKVPEVKHSPANGRRVDRALGALIGVVQVEANPITANVLVYFDPALVDAADLEHALCRLGMLQKQPAARAFRDAHLLRHASERLGTAVLHSVIEGALTRLLWLL